jgi:uncharacterized radical SAM superfamily Fe-S cluster-containing enzyme
MLENVLRKTKSICPVCLKVVDAELFIDKDDKVKIRKECKEHGYCEDTYTFSSPEQYLWAEKFSHKGDGIENPRTSVEKECPFDCGICPNHKSHTVLSIIDLTNRCNLRCPICFANAAESGYVYDLSFEQVRNIVKNLRSNSPVPSPALQLSGGEPTLRDDLPDILRMARDEGFVHIEVNTNGVRFANDIDFFKKNCDAGLDTIYLQFDGLSNDVYEKTRGLPLLDTKFKVIENARKIGFGSIVLVVTLVKGVNDHQLGEIIKFAMKNHDVIRCVNVQPVSITGRINPEERRSMRINTTDFIELAEKQTNELVEAKDFFPVPSVVPISLAVGSLKHRRYVEFTTSPWCGVATFLFKLKEDKWVPITKLANVEKFFNSMMKVHKELSEGHKLRGRFYALASLRHVKANIVKSLLWPILSTGSYIALGNFMRRIVMVGCMHFMDPYNFDIDRLQQCVIHYGLPDGTIRPFCSMNSIHRSNIEKEYSVPYDDFLKKKREPKIATK